MKAIAAILIVLALIVGVVPQFTDCLARGRTIELTSGSSLPMRCHWTRQAEIAVALPLLGVGMLMLLARRPSTLRALAAVGSVLGISAILLPTYLIGTCGNPEMICNLLMKPILLFAGILTVVTAGIGLVYLRGEAPGGLGAETEDHTP